MPSTGRIFRNLAKRLLRRFFELGQRLGLDLLPRHMYSEIPDIRALKGSSHWKKPFSMQGVAGIDPDTQLAFVEACCTAPIVAALKAASVHAEASKRNGEEGFGPTESDFLFAYVASQRPAQILQIGCGVSTAVCLLAAEHAGYAPEISCVEPYPTDFLLREAQRERIVLIKEKVELLDPGICDRLGSDLLFFVDSTHTLGPAGEVSRVILEMLPRLKRGARVHFHDITFPYDYDPHILDSALFFPHESALLHAFLAFNSRFRILASLSMLHYSSQRQLAEYLPNYRPAPTEDGLANGAGHFPSSIYLEITA